MSFGSNCGLFSSMASAQVSSMSSPMSVSRMTGNRAGGSTAPAHVEKPIAHANAMQPDKMILIGKPLDGWEGAQTHNALRIYLSELTAEDTEGRRGRELMVSSFAFLCALCGEMRFEIIA